MKTASILRNNPRTMKLIVLALVVISWIGVSYSIVPDNMLVGTILILVTFIMGDQEVRSGVLIMIFAITVMWVSGPPVFGLVQESILPDAQWSRQVMILFYGIGAIRLAEIIVVRIRKLRDFNLATTALSQKLTNGDASGSAQL